jgi:holin-like protein
MLRGLAILLVFQSIGEVASRFLHGAMPGPVIGLVLLFIFLVARKRIDDSMATSVMAAADALLAHLSIFFIPAAVGVMLYVSTLAQSGVAWILAIVLSTTAAIATTALVLRWLSKPSDDVTADHIKTDSQASDKP